MNDLDVVALTLPDVDRALFQVRRLSNAPQKGIGVISPKCSQVILPVLGPASVDCWHMAGWPLSAAHGGVGFDPGLLGFAGDADPSAVVQYLALLQSFSQPCAQEANVIPWVGVTGQWLQCAAAHLTGSWTLESLSLSMPAEEIEAWSALRRSIGPLLDAWLGADVTSWLDRGRKFELDAFHVRNFKHGYAASLAKVIYSLLPIRQ